MVALGLRPPAAGVFGAEITVVNALAGAETVEVAPFETGTPAVALTVLVGTAATVAPTLAAGGVIVIIPLDVGVALFRSPRI